eukprot:GFUD01030824.1.p2 GENE.GFUD01030824.1~~GFUD01030824.1.p2  ORF type:complete len:206 (-),score=90.97 GFUD01030824.1:90-707(-)
MCSMMDQERMEGEEVARMVQGSLLNKVYEIQFERERQFNLVSQMMQMTVSPCQTLPNCDKQGMSCLDSAPNNMRVEEQQNMEVPPNPAYTQYLLERSTVEGTSCDPHSQEVKRNDPVYLTSMASHGVWHSEDRNRHQISQQQQQQLAFQQQLLELQQQQQLEFQHQQELEDKHGCCQILAQQLGGFVLPNKQPDLIPLMDSMMLE